MLAVSGCLDPQVHLLLEGNLGVQIPILTMYSELDLELQSEKEFVLWTVRFMHTVTVDGGFCDIRSEEMKTPTEKMVD